MTRSTAQGVTLCKKKAELQPLSEADRDAMEARRDFWKRSGEFIYCHHVMPREQLYVPKGTFPNSVH